MTNERLSFIASRRRGVETYYFAKLPQPFVIEPEGRMWRFRFNTFDTRRQAFRAVLNAASYQLERQPLR